MQEEVLVTRFQQLVMVLNGMPIQENANLLFLLYHQQVEVQELVSIVILEILLVLL